MWCEAHWCHLLFAHLRAAAERFVGRHNFCNFANTFPDEVDPCKEIRRLVVTEAAPHLIRLEVEGSGFLYKMVRHMVRPCHLLDACSAP